MIRTLNIQALVLLYVIAYTIGKAKRDEADLKIIKTILAF
jgi:hypothetical protein